MEVPANSCMYGRSSDGLMGFPDGGSAKTSSTTSTIPPILMSLMTRRGGGVGGGSDRLDSSIPRPNSTSSSNNSTSSGSIMGGGHAPTLLSSPTNGFLLPPSSSSSSSSCPHFLLLPPPVPSHDDQNCYAMDDSSGSLKAKIMAHPHYPRLLTAYANCHKVGAPPEVIAQLEEACVSEQAASTGREGGSMGCIGEDPALDQFMEAYCEMLTKYEQELTKPFKEAMLFINKIESQFKALTLSSSQSQPAGFSEGIDRDMSEDEIDASENQIDPQAEDRELKDQLLKRYSGYLGSLKQEFLKKRKKGKLPKEARQQLLDWWGRHYKWPYPSESQKLALAESTGLDQKQINNWFINQRKRHWRPSEEMQLVVMDASHPHYYMDDMAAHHFPMDCSPMLL